MTAQTQPIKTRFAPSPTGFMHFGNVRAALFNYLFAKGHQGHFVLRIEDTDLARSEDQFRDSIFRDLEWLNLNLSEPAVYQSKRQEIYDEYYRVLEEQNLVYPCFCTEAQLAISRKVQLSQGLPPRYPGTCLNLSDADIQAKKAEGIPYTLRFRIPKGAKIEFNDLIKGPQKFETDHIGDFIVRRHDGTPPFMYCNAIDDSRMGITHALRGDDHLTNTPRQILILQALKLPIPQYGHFPTILGSDSKPLSKRTGSRSIQELREEGYLAIGILNYMARLGHHDPSVTLLDLDQLASHFDLKNIGRSPAHYDEQQLHFWQKEAMHHASFEEAWSLIQKYLDEALLSEIKHQHAERAFVDAVKSNIVLPSEAKYWARVFFSEGLPYEGDVLNAIKEVGPAFFQSCIELFKAESEPKTFIASLQEKTKLKGKALFMPIRAALTMTLHGPELPKILTLLSKEKVIHRFAEARDHA